MRSDAARSPLDRVGTSVSDPIELGRAATGQTSTTPARESTRPHDRHSRGMEFAPRSILACGRAWAGSSTSARLPRSGGSFGGGRDASGRRRRATRASASSSIAERERRARLLAAITTVLEIATRRDSRPPGARAEDLPPAARREPRQAGSSRAPAAVRQCARRPAGRNERHRERRGPPCGGPRSR